MKRLTRLASGALLLTLFALGTASLGGCNTMEGAGEDIEDAGDAVQDAVDD